MDSERYVQWYRTDRLDDATGPEMRSCARLKRPRSPELCRLLSQWSSGSTWRRPSMMVDLPVPRPPTSTLRMNLGPTEKTTSPSRRQRLGMRFGLCSALMRDSASRANWRRASTEVPGILRRQVDPGATRSSGLFTSWASQALRAQSGLAPGLAEIVCSLDVLDVDPELRAGAEIWSSSTRISPGWVVMQSTVQPISSLSMVWRRMVPPGDSRLSRRCARRPAPIRGR